MHRLIFRLLKRIFSILSTLCPQAAIALALYLFTTPSKHATGRKKREAKVSHPAQKSTLSYQGLTIQVYQWGEMTKPVLLLHGWESNSYPFSAIIERLLQQGYSPVTFDLPGHGHSQGKTATVVQASAISRLLQQQFGTFEAIIAHSFGVLCAFYALKEGLRANKIIAINGVCDFPYLLDQFVNRFQLSTSIEAALKSKIEAFFTPLTDIWNRFSVSDSPQKITQPILLIHDIADNVVPIAQAQKTALAYPHQLYYHQAMQLGHTKILSSQAIINIMLRFIDGSNIQADLDKMNITTTEISY